MWRRFFEMFFLVTVAFIAFEVVVFHALKAILPP
jgi:hypothetical protein